MRRTRLQISQLSILAALSAPMPKPKRVEVGWFIPNSAELRAQMQAIHKRPGKRIAVEPLPNGPVKFFEEDC